MNYLGSMSKYPLCVTIKQGQEPRTVKQNRLQWQWFLDMEAQGDMTATEYRAYCKLHEGVPLLRAENEEFKEQYDRIVKPLPYESKLGLMLEPISFPVTSLMSVKQHKRFLDRVYTEFTGKGFLLTDPNQFGLDNWWTRQ